MATPSVSSLKGTGYKQISLPRLSPDQQQLFSQVMSGIQPGLSGGISQLSQMASGGSPEYWEQLEAPALGQFGALTGQLASRFSGMGSGARRSSGFQHATTSAASDLAQQLAAQRMGLQQNAISQLLGLYGSLMGTQTSEMGFVPKRKKWWEDLLGGISPAIGQGLGMLPFSGFI